MNVYIVDKEEFRIDKSVKVTRKEYNDLMNELYEFTESYLEFNGCETFKSDTINIENDDSKVIGFKHIFSFNNHLKSIIPYCILLFFLNLKCNIM